MLLQVVGSAPRACAPLQRLGGQRPLLRPVSGAASLQLTPRQQRRAAGRRAAAARASLTGSGEEQAAAAAAPPAPPAGGSSSSSSSSVAEAPAVEAKPDIKQTMADLDALLGIEPEKEAPQVRPAQEPPPPCRRGAASPACCPWCARHCSQLWLLSRCGAVRLLAWSRPGRSA